jgi:hypothetical protein
MVQDPRAPSDADPLRPLNPPLPIKVIETKYHAPIALILNGQRLGIARIEEVWRIDEEWWRPQAIARIYYRLILKDGRAITIFRDLVEGSWYRQQA